jgi:hypothetical protein
MDCTGGADIFSQNKVKIKIRQIQERGDFRTGRKLSLRSAANKGKSKIELS